MKKVILKIVTITIVLCMLLSINTSFYADTVTYIIAEDVIINENTDEIEIPVYISENQGIMGFMIFVTYGSHILKPVSVERGNALGAGLLNDSIGASEDGLIKIMWTGSENMYTDGLIFKLKFKVLSKNFHSAHISFKYSQPDTFNEQYDDVKLAFDECNVINTSCKLKGDVDGNNVISIMDATAIQKYLADINELDDSAKKLADFNGDNTINVVDATDIQKRLANIE